MPLEFESLFFEVHGSALGDIMQARSYKARGLTMDQNMSALYEANKLPLLEFEEVDLQELQELKYRQNEKIKLILMEDEKRKRGVINGN